MKVLLLIICFFVSLQVKAQSEYFEIIQNAADLVGVDAALLLAMGHKESNFRNIRAKAGGTAEGIMQITDRTWRHLLNRYANDYDVALDASKFDPWSNAVMAAAYLKENQIALKRTLKRNPTPGELYMAHLLGLSGATKLFKSDLNRQAKDVVSYAYKSNSRLFKTSAGKQRTVRQFRDYLNWRFGTLVTRYQSVVTETLYVNVSTEDYTYGFDIPGRVLR